MPERFFCPRPFEVAEVQRDGSVYLCCAGWMPKPIGNLRSHSLAAIWLGDAARTARRKMLTGDFSLCSSCPFLSGEQTGGPLVPLSEAARGQYVALFTDPDSEPTEIGELNLAYDRTCNLSCPSCRPRVDVATPLMVKRIEELQEKVLENDLLARTRRLKITGAGDPFASVVFRRLLQRLRPTDYPNLRLLIHTNGQLLNPANWAALGEARYMIEAMEISVDAATPHTYSINRRGGSWERLMTNLAFVRELRLSGQLPYLQLDYVIQANNWRELKDFVRLARDHACDRVMCTPLRNWGTYSSSEFRQRNVCQEAHPEHASYAQFVAALPLPFFDPKSVNLDWHPHSATSNASNDSTSPNE